MIANGLEEVTQATVFRPRTRELLMLRRSVALEIGGAERNPLACTWQLLLGDRFPKMVFTELECEHQLSWRLVRRTQSLAHHVGRQREGAVSPSETVRGKPH